MRALEHLGEVLRAAGEARAELRRGSAAGARGTGARMMSLTRSGGIVEKFCSTGTTALPSVGSFLSDSPGWQST